MSVTSAETIEAIKALAMVNPFPRAGEILTIIREWEINCDEEPEWCDECQCTNNGDCGHKSDCATCEEPYEYCECDEFIPEGRN